MESEDEESGFDGSSITLGGYKNSKNEFNRKSKIISRWSAERTALGALFNKMMKQSGADAPALMRNFKD